MQWTLPVTTDLAMNEVKQMKSHHRYLDEHTCKIWLYLHEYILEHGMAPSYREIARNAFLSISSVQVRLDWMEMREYIQRKQGIARSIVLLKSIEEVPELCGARPTHN